MIRAFSTLFLVFVALLLVGAGYWWMHRPEIILVDGRKVEVKRAGAGTPAVIFETGFTGGIGLTSKLQSGIARTVETLAYERAGIGHSDIRPAPRDAEQIARELHQILAAVHIAPPYVLVGHSAGGIFVRVFAHMYPREVAGLVFVDPATEDFYEHMRATTQAEWNATTDALQKLGATSGLTGQWSALPQSFEEACAAWPLPSVPTLILMSTKPLGQWPLKTTADLQALHQSQSEMASKIPGVKVLQIEGTNHLSILSAPETSGEILKVVAEAKSRMPLQQQ